MSKLLLIANVVLGIVLFVTSLRYYRSISRSWVKLAYALVGAYWAIVYAIIWLAPESLWHNQLFSLTLIRSGITMTLGVMAAGGIARLKTWNG